MNDVWIYIPQVVEIFHAAGHTNINYTDIHRAVMVGKQSDIPSMGARKGNGQRGRWEVRLSRAQKAAREYGGKWLTVKQAHDIIYKAKIKVSSNAVRMWAKTGAYGLVGNNTGHGYKVEPQSIKAAIVNYHNREEWPNRKKIVTEKREARPYVWSASAARQDAAIATTVNGGGRPNL